MMEGTNFSKDNKKQQQKNLKKIYFYDIANESADFIFLHCPLVFALVQMRKILMKKKNLLMHNCENFRNISKKKKVFKNFF